MFYQKFNSSIPYNFDVREYKNCSYPLHFHRDFELLIPLSGEINIAIGSESFTVCEGEYALALQNEPHSFSVGEDGALLVAVFSEDYVREFAEAMKKRRTRGHALRLKAALRELLLCDLACGERLTLCALLSLICADFYKNATEDGACEEGAKGRDMIKEVIAYIGEHYKERLTLYDLSAHLGYGEYYISHKLNDTLGKSFTGLVNEYRIYHARYLLALHPERTITDIALDSGFGSVRNFNRAYKTLVGEAPKRMHADQPKKDTAD
jgi:AraC-like DNA-binding protein